MKLIMIAGVVAAVLGTQSQAAEPTSTHRGLGAPNTDSVETRRKLDGGRLIYTDTISIFGAKDSLGRCKVSLRARDLEGKGRIIDGEITLLNEKTCEYRRIRRVYQTDTAKASKEEKGLLSTSVAGLRYEFYDKYSTSEGSRFDYEVTFDDLGCVGGSGIQYAQGFFGSNIFSTWDAYELFIGGASSGCLMDFQRAGAWFNFGHPTCMPISSSYGDILLEITPNVGGVADWDAYLYGKILCDQPLTPPVDDYIGLRYGVWGVLVP